MNPLYKFERILFNCLVEDFWSLSVGLIEDLEVMIVLRKDRGIIEVSSLKRC